jgi:L-ribulose-5-phosphate 3-epimerase UlaE
MWPLLNVAYALNCHGITEIHVGETSETSETTRRTIRNLSIGGGNSEINFFLMISHSRHQVLISQEKIKGGLTEYPLKRKCKS